MGFANYMNILTTRFREIHVYHIYIYKAGPSSLVC